MSSPALSLFHSGCLPVSGRLFFAFKTIDNHIVRLVYLGNLDGGEVDLRGYFGVMPHGTADDVEGDLVGLGDAGPAVARHIEGQGSGELEVRGEPPQMAVDGLGAGAVFLWMS